jgi:hypothetical protein
LHDELSAALTSGRLEDIDGGPDDDLDGVRALLAIYELWLAPVDTLDGTERFQNHPVIAGIKWRLEQRLIEQFDAWLEPTQPTSADPVDALRRIAHRDDSGVYDWVATAATWDQLVMFLAIEGGPDGGFDDLVSLCQVGIRGEAKVVLGANYWDEMGGGDPAAVHTVLHERLCAAVEMPRLRDEELPVSALYRKALNGLLATNRALQAEMIGALGLLELEAGPNCRRVLRALERLSAPADAIPFYAEHASTDPRHGKEWLDGAVAPLVEAQPSWGPRIIRGARWRAELNDRLFADVKLLLTHHLLRTA